MVAASVPLGFLLTTTCEVDDGARRLRELIARLDRSIFEVHVACVSRAGTARDHLQQPAASVTEFTGHRFLTSILLARVAGWCRAHRLALIQTCDRQANVIGLVAGAFARVPVRIAECRARDDIQPSARRGERLACRLAHCVVTDSDATAHRLIACGVPLERIRVILNGVEARSRAGRTYRVRRRRVVVAPLAVERDAGVLADAAVRLARYGDLHFEIEGAGPCEAALRREVGARGLLNQFTFHAAKEPRRTFDEADLFVLPRQSRAFPNALLEAMAASIPTVTTGGAGLHRLVDRGRTGLQIRPDDPAALADAIASLVDKPDRAMAMAAAARRHVEALCSWDRMAARFAHLYLTELAACGLVPPVAALRDRVAAVSPRLVADAAHVHARCERNGEVT